MSLLDDIYWRLGVWKLDRWWSNATGRVGCWWRGAHEPVWTIGSLTPIMWMSRDGSDRPLPETKYWQGSYCLNCGKTLDGKPFMDRDE